ncbi:MAG: 5'-3' exonuclease [Patescibacteria group bacterium]
MKKKRLVLIDTFNFLHRAYHALPKSLTDKEGNPTNAVYGVTSMLLSVFDSLHPDYAVVANESKEKIKRVEAYENYKAHRKPMDEDLKMQIPKVYDIISAFGLRQLTIPGYEADDIIGTLATRFGKDDIEVIIVSNDRDLWQLINDNVLVMMPVNGGQVEWVGAKEVEKRMGFKPDKMIDYKALRGDPSDNIPGVKGIGDKTAKALLDEFDSLDAVYENLSKINPNSLKEKLEVYKEDAFISKMLATIVTDLDLDVELSDCLYQEFNKGNVKDALLKYNFKSLIKRMGFDLPNKKIETPPDSQLSLL